MSLFVTEAIQAILFVITIIIMIQNAVMQNRKYNNVIKLQSKLDLWR